MKKIILLFIALLVFSGCEIQKSTQDVMNEVISDVGSLSTIDYFDNYLYDGGMYRISQTFTLGTANDTSLIVFDNGSGTVVLDWEIKGLVATTVLITEGGATIDSTIIALTPINLYRNSTNTTGIDSVSSVPEDSTGISRYGSTLFDISFGALQNARGRIILKSDSLTVFKITTDANTNKVNCNFEWIEY